MARQQRRARPSHKAKRPAAKSDYFMKPGKRGAVIVLRKPLGNRITAKVCGVMPTRVHAKMLIIQLEKAESFLKELFLEATDYGMEALEAVLAACCKEVIEKGPKVREPRGEPAPETADASESGE